MKASIYELITLHEKLQTLENCERILSEWTGFGNVLRAIHTETNKVEKSIQEIMKSEQE